MEMPLSASGRFIVDADGRRVRLAGVNWYGPHEDDGVPPGLDRTGRRTLAARIALLGFNSVRLPFSLWMTEQTTPIPGEYLVFRERVILTSGHGSPTMVDGIDCECGGSAARS
jgi:hypothetical protein